MEELDTGKIEGRSNKCTYYYNIYPDRIEISKLDAGEYFAFIKIHKKGTFDFRTEVLGLKEDDVINKKNIMMAKEKYRYGYEPVKKFLESGEPDRSKFLYLEEMFDRLLSTGLGAWF